MHYMRNRKGIDMDQPAQAQRPNTVKPAVRDELGRKQCARCHEWRDESLFGSNRTSVDGFQARCKACCKESSSIERYGLTARQLADLIVKQGGGCAICGHNILLDDRWAVDHDHSCCAGIRTCGKCVRGALCYSCNLGLGKFKDSPELLANAMAYLKGNNNVARRSEPPKPLR